MITEQDIAQSTALTELDPLFPTLYTAFEDAASKARALVPQVKSSIDHEYYVQTVRYNARVYFESQAEAVGYEVMPLSNYGIELKYRCYRLKALKTATPLIVPEPPGVPPAKTGARRQFCEHNNKAEQLAFHLTTDDIRCARMGVTTLIMLWEPGYA